MKIQTKVDAVLALDKINFYLKHDLKCNVINKTISTIDDETKYCTCGIMNQREILFEIKKFITSKKNT